MQRQYFELDPDGDVLLTLRHPNLQRLVWGLSTPAKPADVQEPGNITHGSVKLEHKPEPGEPMAGLDEPNATE
ncbi:uncharacterized protein TrAFT101_008436 [Trichoderma asperellum]|uniref:uncharacterized protein n=1 Tax=Trichoderma asperellum TaxID=101201 RepID=UPI00332FB1E8|nr:hypothetical protein TrAFT101_008436 [Trichoderma asperellum]